MIMAMKSSLKCILMVNLLMMVRSDLHHISGPDDRHTFKDNAVNLTCQVTDASGYAIVWHAVDNDGAGSIVGKCFNCPSEETCSVQTGMDIDYTAMKEGDTYTLTILNPQVPHTDPFGHFQCGYQEIENCDSTPNTIGKFNLFQTAIVFVYDFPTCKIAIPNVSGSIYRELTCSWKPRFYRQDNNCSIASLTSENEAVEPDLCLSFGVISRKTIASLRDVERPTSDAMCTVNLPENLSRSCNFPSPMEQDINMLIIPLYASIRSGESQEFRCQVQPNATMERTWVLFQKGGPTDTITTSTNSTVGNVTFSTASREYLLLKPRTSGISFFLECIVSSLDGRNVSAFASIYIHEEANFQSSTLIVMTAETSEVSNLMSTMTPGKESVSPSTSIAVTTGSLNSVSASLKMSTNNNISPSTSASMASVLIQTFKPTVNSTFVKPSEEPASDNNKGNTIIFVVVAVIIVILILIVVGFAHVWKRKQKRSFKQAPRKVDVQYGNTGPGDSVVVFAENKNETEKELKNEESDETDL